MTQSHPEMATQFILMETRDYPFVALSFAWILETRFTDVEGVQRLDRCLGIV